jgi:hypothetical protein
VVHATGGFLSTGYRYLASHKELAFLCTSSEPLNLPGDAELVLAKKIWIPR